MTPERKARISHVLDHRQPDLSVITDQVHKIRNIAAIVRSCDAVGVHQIHCVMPETGYQIFGGAAASATKWVEQCHYSDVREPIDSLRQQGFQIVAANKNEGAINFREVDYCMPTAILLGAEVEGVSRAASELADVNVFVPMVGMVESYNVSVACSAILLEAERQRSERGLYAEPRLDETTRARLFFQWAHPVVASFCDEKGIPYPEVREDGEIIEPAAWLKGVGASA